MSTWCWIAFIGLQSQVQGAEREVHRHQLEISASGASIVRREAGGAAGDGGDVPLKAETSIDTYYGGDRVLDDCTGLKQTWACSDVNSTAALCESYKASQGGNFYRCSWKMRKPKTDDQEEEPPECYLDQKAGVCSRQGDSSANATGQ
ncbi:unnamed protein product [Durusdinium trenchii]|uniref:Uncharacterized protein n=1 Tax=Durusdinium trenchii TaxID=1381693 RepID=A0ABP0JHU3_9DINO